VPGQHAAAGAAVDNNDVIGAIAHETRLRGIERRIAAGLRSDVNSVASSADGMPL
jgi:hypothetical protein